MQSEQAYLNDIFGSSYVDVYCASYIPRYEYPNRLMHAGAATESMRPMCTRLIIDSAYQDDEMTNAMVLNQALKQRADVVIPKDFPGEPEKTFESLCEFLDIYHDVDGRKPIVMPVLQPPYVEHYRAHEAFYQQFGRLAIGGLQGLTDTEERVTRLTAISDAVSPHTQLHAFGVGTSLAMIRAIRDDPNLVDSFDTKTAEFAIINNQIPNKEWVQQGFSLPGGTDIATVNGQFAKAVLLNANFMLTDRVDDEVLDETYKEQTTLGDVESMIDDLPASKREYRGHMTPETDSPAFPGSDHEPVSGKENSQSAGHPNTQSGLDQFKESERNTS